MVDGRVVDKPVDHASWGRLRALYKWLKPATRSSPLPSRTAPDRGDLPGRIGRYAIERRLGEGGMGVVALGSPSFDPCGALHVPAILEEAEAGRHQALAAFREAGGERLLGR